MKFFIIIASLVALTVAGPANVDYQPIAGGPAFVEGPIAVGPADTPVASAPLVQIILNINQPGQIVGTPVVIGPELPTSPVQVVDDNPEVSPVQVVDVAPEPVDISVPIVVFPQVPEDYIGFPVLPGPQLPYNPPVILEE